jgi:ABC-2 type transport system ATP-binding protein
VLILDEPTSGLDPEQVAEIRELVKSLRGQRTIVFSSHILSEVSQVAQRVVIINRGRIVAEDHPEGLARRIAGTVTVHLRAEAPTDELHAVLSAVPGVVRLTVAGERFRFDARDESVVREASRTVTSRGWVLLELTRESLSLEEIFLRLVHDERAPREAVEEHAS